MPHSEILGSKPARGSPRLFAACHVLHRLLAPRHPPDALAFLHPRQPPPQTMHPMRSATSRGPRPSTHSADEEGRSGEGTVAGEVQRLPSKGRPCEERPAYPCQMTSRPQDGKTNKRPERRLADARHARRTGRIAPPHARNGHLITTSRCPNSIGLPRLSQRGGRERLVGLGRLERPTSRLSGVRSNQLSYRPKIRRSESRGQRSHLSLRPRPDGCCEGTCRRRHEPHDPTTANQGRRMEPHLAGCVHPAAGSP